MPGNVGEGSLAAIGARTRLGPQERTDSFAKGKADLEDRMVKVQITLVASRGNHLVRLTIENAARPLESLLSVTSPTCATVARLVSD
jgi:hypothetical protein